MSRKDFEVLSRETVYSGFFSLEKYALRHTLYQGGWSQTVSRELFRRNNCVAVLLYDPERDEVVLTEQFRVGALQHPQRAWLLEIVAGAIEDGETAEQVAYRESLEEAGCEIGELLEIMQFYTTPGGSSERITLYCGRVDSSRASGVHGLQEEGEDILVSTVKAEQAFKLLADGGFESGPAIIAIQWLYMHRQRLREQWLGA
ncbi:MAG: NUDIX domain-containing protein [Methylococcales bacterium]|nr:NUDIX domain-containing protein [Methylococcales bacterium]